MVSRRGHRVKPLRSVAPAPEARRHTRLHLPVPTLSTCARARALCGHTHSRKRFMTRPTASILVVAALALAAPWTAARATDPVLGAAVGAGAGALLGQALGGRDAAIVGGALGAATGAALAAQPVHYGRVRPRGWVYGPPAAVYLPPAHLAPPVYYAPPAVYHAPPVYYYGPALRGHPGRGWRHGHDRAWRYGGPGGHGPRHGRWDHWD